MKKIRLYLKYVMVACTGFTPLAAQMLPGQVNEVTPGRPYSIFSDIAISPDGRLAAVTQSTKSEIWLISIADAAVVRTLEGHPIPPGENPRGNVAVRAVAFSPDGKYLVSGGSDQWAKIWEVSTGKLLHTLKGHKRDVSSVAYSRDGKIVATGGYDLFLKIWDASSGKMLHSYNVDRRKGGFVKLAIAPDSTAVVVSHTDWFAHMYEISTGKLLRSLAYPAMKFCNSWPSFARYSPDGKSLAIIFRSQPEKAMPKEELKNFMQGNVATYETSSYTVTRAFAAHKSAGWRLAYTNDNQTLATTGFGDRTVRFWNLSTGQNYLNYQYNSQYANAYEFDLSSMSNKLLVGAPDGRIKIFELNSQSRVSKPTVSGIDSAAQAKAFFKGLGAMMPEYGNLVASRVMDEDLVHLRHFPKLTSLSLSRTSLGGAGLKHLQWMGPTLTSLGLAETQIDDASLENLKYFPNLKLLGLSQCNITSAGLVHLRHLKKLETLSIISTSVDDSAFEMLDDLPNLKLIQVSLWGKMTKQAAENWSRKRNWKVQVQFLP
jgi:WD40 repeat protein